MEFFDNPTGQFYKQEHAQHHAAKETDHEHHLIYGAICYFEHPVEKDNGDKAECDDNEQGHQNVDDCGNNGK